METVFAHWEVIDLTENHIRQLHRDLLKYSTKDERHRGEYKSLRNDVAAFDAGGKDAGGGSGQAGSHFKIWQFSEPQACSLQPTMAG